MSPMPKDATTVLMRAEDSVLVETDFISLVSCISGASVLQ